jgi:hypothetical protein
MALTNDDSNSSSNPNDDVVSMADYDIWRLARKVGVVRKRSACLGHAPM